jgi:D-alanyl-D-alanine carboxypeptidase/D-alanyl-D-alanine-endopeptidase (penicillin-binding protein 4)
LIRELQQLVVEASHLDIGVAVSEASGAMVVEHRADQPLVPASTAKMVTSAAALLRFGGEHRFKTRLATTVPIGPDGVVHGDLVLIGGGDPTLGTPIYNELRPDRPHTPIGVVADLAAAAGIKRVTGRLIGDTSHFIDQPTAPTWRAVNLAEGNATRITGLSIDGGRRLWWSQGAAQGEVAGNPAVEATNAFKTALRNRGIHVNGGTAVSTQAVPAAFPVAEVASPPLWHILRWAVQASDNYMTDTVFRSVGRLEGDSSWQGSAHAVWMTLARSRIEMSGTVMADGSGLSHMSRLTPRTLTQIDALMMSTAHAGVWVELFAVAGVRGTLRNRLTGTVAAGRVRGKTGTLRDVKSLTGHVIANNAPRYRFTIIGNSLDHAGKIRVIELQDELTLLLAQASVACEPNCPG